MSTHYWRSTEIFQQRVKDGLQYDLEAGDRVQVHLRNTFIIGRVVTIAQDCCLVKMADGNRWFHLKSVAYLPTRRNIRERMEMVKQHWDDYQKFDKARWAQCDFEFRSYSDNFMDAWAG